MQDERIPEWEELKELFDQWLNLTGRKREEFLDSILREQPDCGLQLKQLVEQYLAAGDDFLKTDPFPLGGFFIIGQVIDGRYRILRLLGVGGMGAVYLAGDSKLGRNVALKFLSLDVDDDPVMRSQLHAEARAAAAVDHPYICKVYDTGEFDSKPFIAMEYVDGQTLRERLKSGAIPFTEGILFSCETAEALMTVHRHEIVHGDLKPLNLMVTRTAHIKLMDFGIACRAERPPDTQITARFGTADTRFPTSVGLFSAPPRAGTRLYMAPEQLRGSNPTIQSDIFSFGLILYEIFTGVHPFRKETAEASFGAILYEDVATAAKADSLPVGVKEIIFRMLSKNSVERYTTAEEVLANLKKIGGGGDASAPPRRTHAIAVLPFADLSPFKDQEYFCHGVAEELINALSMIDGLRVASRASSFRFRNNELEPAEVGRRLKVDSILDGSVRKVGDKLRIAVSLIEVETGYQIWSERYDRSLADIFQIQDEISACIVHRFQAGHSNERKSSAAVKPNIAAYDLYLKGRYKWNQRTEAALGASIDSYHQAIVLDHSYAAAYAGLADSYATLGLYGAGAPADTMMLARSAAERALDIDPSSAEALTSLACVRCVYEWNWEAGEHDFKAAIQKYPRYSIAHQWYANHCLAPLGRFDEAYSELQCALDLDEASLAIAASIGVNLYFRRQYDEAIAEHLRILQTNPGFGMGYYFLGQAYTEKGLLEDAVAMLERASDLTGRSSESITMLGRALADLGRVAEAQKILNELLDRSNRTYVSPVLFAILSIALKEFDRALDYLHRAVKVRATDLIWINIRPMFDVVRDRPDFVKICKDDVKLARSERTIS
jgi:serine/threonine-protein kinase